MSRGLEGEDVEENIMLFVTLNHGFDNAAFPAVVQFINDVKGLLNTHLFAPVHFGGHYIYNPPSVEWGKAHDCDEIILTKQRLVLYCRCHKSNHLYLMVHFNDQINKIRDDVVAAAAALDVGTSPVSCHLCRATCIVSPVSCHLYRVTCIVSPV